jgi:type II secretory pathway pseudopilin PulG
MKKKSQMEIMGLAIVVVLLVLGMLFAVKFILFPQQTSYRPEYTNTQLAANMINTILNTDTNCSGISIGELLIDASKDTYVLNCGSLSSQQFVNSTISNILTQTLKVWKKDYFFMASVPGKTVVYLETEYNTRVRERKTHFLPTDVGIMTIVMDIYG